MSDFGLTDYGLQIPSYEDWRDLYYEKAKNTYGAELNVGSSSVVGQFLSIFAYIDIQSWEALQAVYNSQTLDGAEGIYLDEILSRRGVFRNQSAPGTGFAYIQTSGQAPWTYIVSNSTSFSATNSQNYIVSTQTALRDRVAAFRVTRSELTAAGSVVTFTMTNASTGAQASRSITTGASTALTDLATFISANIIPSETSKVFVTNNTVYVGYLATNLDRPVGLNTAVRFFASANLGTKWSLIPVVATVEGVYPVYLGEITGVTPTPPVGFQGVGNFSEFYAGREVETDAEYRARYNDTVDEANAATRPAIYKAISDLDGVQKVRIYDNPTATDTPEAPAFTFNTIVLGGQTAQIAQTLFDKKPINTLTFGSVSYTVSLPDGGTEIIRYTPAGEKEYSVRVRYRTVNDQPLTQEETDRIKSAFVVLSASFNIGTKVFNAQLQSVVFSSIDYGRLSFLEVQTKLASQPDSSFNTNDINTAFGDIVVIKEEDVSFEQVV